ncbi:hypothetical protein D3C72_2385270 [compost metagenome]
MRRTEQAQVLQVAEDVADGGRPDIQPGQSRQRLRTDRLTILDVARDQRPQQMAGARRKM